MCSVSRISDICTDVDHLIYLQCWNRIDFFVLGLVPSLELFLLMIELPLKRILFGDAIFNYYLSTLHVI